MITFQHFKTPKMNFNINVITKLHTILQEKTLLLSERSNILVCIQLYASFVSGCKPLLRSVISRHKWSEYNQRAVKNSLTSFLRAEMRHRYAVDSKLPLISPFHALLPKRLYCTKFV